VLARFKKRKKSGGFEGKLMEGVGLGTWSVKERRRQLWPRKKRGGGGTESSARVCVTKGGQTKSNAGLLVRQAEAWIWGGDGIEGSGKEAGCATAGGRGGLSQVAKARVVG